MIVTFIGIQKQKHYPYDMSLCKRRIYYRYAQHIQEITLLDHSFAPQAIDKFQQLSQKQSHQSN